MPVIICREDKSGWSPVKERRNELLMTDVKNEWEMYLQVIFKKACIPKLAKLHRPRATQFRCKQVVKEGTVIALSELTGGKKRADLAGIDLAVDTIDA